MRNNDLHSSLESNGNSRRGLRIGARFNRDSSAGLMRRNTLNNIPVIIQDGDSDGGRHPGRWRVHHLGNDGIEMLGIRAMG